MYLLKRKIVQGEKFFKRGRTEVLLFFILLNNESFIKQVDLRRTGDTLGEAYGVFKSAVQI
jgi:hypothetical protein